jgi:hypothetical protein
MRKTWLATLSWLLAAAPLPVVAALSDAPSDAPADAPRVGQSPPGPPPIAGAPPAEIIRDGRHEPLTIRDSDEAWRQRHERR